MAAQIRVSKILGTSANLMQQMRRMLPIKQVQDVCMEMSKEMFKAGLIEETLDETFAALDDDEIETAADTEVDRVLGEVLEGVMVKGSMKDRTTAEVEAEKASTKEEDDMIARLTNL